MKKRKFCSICGDTLVDFGNNAQPVNNGRCCDMCDAKFVIPMRFVRFARGLDMREVSVQKAIQQRETSNG